MVRFGLVLALIVFAADQATKYLVLEQLRFSPHGCLEAGIGCGFIELSPVFDLRMVWNRGISFGLLPADSEIARWGLVAAMAMIAAVFAWWLKGAEKRLTAIALGLVIGGALGNMIDRIRFGAVADFLDFNGLFFPWVFNVADAAITVGAILLAADLLLFTEAEPGQGTGWARLKQRLRGLNGPPGGAPGGGGG